MGLMPIILMFGLLYFLMIRPQMKRAKEQKAMTDALQKNDEVITSAGIVGLHQPGNRPGNRGPNAESRGADTAAQRLDQSDVLNRVPS